MKIIITFGITVLLLIFIFLYSGYSGKEKKRKSGLSSILNDNAFLVDVRTPEEYTKKHIDGSENIPLQNIEKNIGRFRGKKHIVVFCRSGRRSERAKEILSGYGFLNVINGGSWKEIQKRLKRAENP